MSKVILTHGFASWNGRLQTTRLIPYLTSAGHEVHHYTYGLIGFIQVRTGNRKRAEAVCKLASPSCVGIGHSNGCAILRLATLMGAPFDKLIFINPALDADADIGPQVKECHVFHNHLDLATGFANLLIKHDWGEMGRVGYKGLDRRFVNHDTGRDYSTRAYGHLGIFGKEAMAFYGPLISSLAAGEQG
jgi:hypothetical protein